MKIRGARKDVQFAGYFDKTDMNNLSRHAPVTKLSVRDGRKRGKIKGRLLLITGYTAISSLKSRIFRRENIPFPFREIRYFRLLFASLRNVELFSSISYPLRVSRKIMPLFACRCFCRYGIVSSNLQNGKYRWC